MGLLIALLVIVVLVLIVFASTIVVVPQQHAVIIERLGKFKEVYEAGLHFKIPFIDRIANRTSLRVSQLDVKLETKTLDNVFVTVVASTQFRVNATDISKAFYELNDPSAQLRAYVEDALRSAIPSMTLDDAFAKKDNVALDVQKTVGNEMSKFGFTVVKTLITAIDPSSAVKEAMDSINSAQREKEATRERAESTRIEIETKAQADAEKTRLQGEGQANYRREIANGIVDQIKSLQAVGMDIKEINNTVMFNQYLDSLNTMAESPNAKTVIIPAGTPGGYSDMFTQITSAIETGKQESVPPAPKKTRSIRKPETPSGK